MAIKRRALLTGGAGMAASVAAAGLAAPARAQTAPSGIRWEHGLARATCQGFIAGKNAGAETSRA
jgi:hypothetical protein